MFVAPLMPVQSSNDASNNRRQLVSQKWGHGISDLGVLLCAVTGEEVVIRERLESGGFPDRQTSTLGWVVVDVVMAILGDV